MNKFIEDLTNFIQFIVSKLDEKSNSYKLIPERCSIVFQRIEYSSDEIANTKESINDKLVVSLVSKIKDNVANTVSEIPVPRAIDNMFIQNGKKKLNINYLDNCPGIVITANDNNKTNTRIYHISFPSEINSYIEVHQDLNSGEVFEPKFYDTVITWNENGTDYSRQFIERTDPINLSEYKYTPYKIKSLLDLDSVPTELNKELVIEVVKGWYPNWRDNIVNKEIISTTDLLIRHLWNNKNQIVGETRKEYYRKGILSVTPIATAIKAFFNLQTDDAGGSSVPTNTNPESYNNLGDKIILSKGTDKNIRFTKMVPSLSDIIDVVVTPDNGNVNRVNEITRAVKIENGVTSIRCYNSQFEPVEVPYYKYITSRVLTSDQVDYSEKRLLVNSDFTYKLSGVRKTGGKSFDYIEAEPDMRVSSVLSRIPMVNFSDSVRASMGARMMAQAIEVVGAEKPLVSSGNDTIDSSLVVTAGISGIIKSIDTNTVTIEGSNGQIATVTRPMSLKGQFNINISYICKVNEGDEVKVGQVIFSPMSIDDDKCFRYGVNFNVAQLNYKGYTHEDAVVISESASKKLAHVTIQDVDLVIDNSIEITDEFLDTPIFKNGDVLALYNKKISKFSSLSNRLNELANINDRLVKKYSATAPSNVGDAFLVDIMVYKCKNQSTVSSNDSFIDKVKSIKLSPDLEEKYEYKKIVESDFEIPENVLINACYVVKFRFFVKNYLNLGDKITNRYGSKGVIGAILPDDEMPHTLEGECIDICMDPGAVNSRKNIPQTMEMNLNLFSKSIRNKMILMIKNGQINDVRPLLKKYHMNNYLKMDDEQLADTILNNELQIITGTHSTVSPATIVEWLNDEGLTGNVKVRDGKNGRPLRNPVMVGKMYMFKLYHLSAKKAQVTANDYISSKLVLGLGKVSGSGISLGTMEMDALFANNLVRYIDRISENNPRKSGWILTHMILGGISIKESDDTESIDNDQNN